MRYLMAIVLGLVSAGCSPHWRTPADLPGSPPAPAVLHDLPPQIRSFIEQQRQLALVLAEKLGVKPDAATLEYFRLAGKGEYRAASLIYLDLRQRGGKDDSPRYDPNLRLPLWDPLLEVQLTLDAYAAGAGKFATAFGRSVVRSIPPGSVYFGGTDTGRGLAAAFSEPDFEGNDLFILTQNQLVDRQHSDYLRARFGDKIYIHSHDDATRVFIGYLEDARRRLEHDQNFPGEPRQLHPGEVVTIVEGKTQVRGPGAVMMINGLLAKTIFDKNPDREFYIEESIPLDWMYPYLLPHGFIMKLNREPQAALRPEIMEKDRAFWRREQARLVGDWLTPETSVKDVCEFAEKVFRRKDLRDFDGDPEFVRNYYASAAWSKLRSAQAGIYGWRVRNATTAEDRTRMLEAADFAYRQALVFQPTNPEVAYGYVNLLLSIGRHEDAALVARTIARIAPDNSSFQHLSVETEGIRRRQR